MLFDICYFMRKRIEANYLKYLKVILETVGFFYSHGKYHYVKVCLHGDR